MPKKDPSHPFTKKKTSTKDTPCKNDLVSPSNYNKNELSKQIKNLNTNPNNNTNSITNTLNNQACPSSTSYNISLNNKKIQKFLNSRKSLKENKSKK